MIYFEIFHGKEAVEQYSSLWDTVFLSGAYEPSVSIDWTQALLKTHVEDSPFLVIVLRNSHEVFGIVPLVIVTVRKYGLSYITAMPISEYYNTHSDLLLMHAKEELADVLLKAIFSLKDKWDIFRIQRFADSSARLEMIERQLEKSTLKYEVDYERPTFFIELGNNYDAYLKKRSKRFRNNLKRHEKMIHSMGRVAYSKGEEFLSSSQAYDKVLYIEENSWKHKQGTAITSISKQKEFYKEFCDRSFKNGLLCLRFLSLNDEPIAYEMGVMQQNKFYSLKASYHEKYKKASPATVLFAWFIKDLIQHGIEEYDFTAEPYAWEGQWTDKLRRHKSLIIFNDTYKAKVCAFYNAMRKKVTNRNELVLQ
jgi:CelD/BcsL family acetyltransferase involved in cellulose biosynthesis